MHRNRGMKRGDSSQGLDEMDNKQQQRSSPPSSQTSWSDEHGDNNNNNNSSNGNVQKSRSMSPHRNNSDLESQDSGRRSFLSSRRSASERNLSITKQEYLDRSSEPQSPDAPRRLSDNRSSEGNRPGLTSSQRSVSERDLGSRNKKQASPDNHSLNSEEWGSFGSFHLPLRTMEEQDMFEQKLLNDLSSGRPSAGGTGGGEEEESTASEGDGGSSAGSFESFAAPPDGSNSTPRKQNTEDNSLFNFFNRNNPGPEVVYDDEEDEGSIFSMSIMSLNTTPFAIQEEEDGDEEEDVSALPRIRSKFTVMTTEEAFDALVVEYAKLMDNVEVAEVMLDQRKMEKSQLSGLVQSREEEYVIRRDCIEKLQATADGLEEELMIEREKDQKISKANKWTSRQKEAWEKLDKAVSKLDELRDENKKMISKLTERPEISNEEVISQMKYNKRRKKTKLLEEQHAKLAAEVNLLRGKKKATSQSLPPLIGLEIVVDENEEEESLTSTDMMSR